MVLEYEFPFLAHASMEPLNATVDLRADSLEIWTGTQMPGIDAVAAGALAGLPADKVKLNCLPAGGGFGRRAVTTSDFVTLAVAVAKTWRANGGSGPIQLLWTREDDMTGGYYRPMHVHRAELGFGPKGELLAWDHVVVGQSIMGGSAFAPASANETVDRSMVEGIINNTYRLPMRLRASHPKVPVPVLWWRSVEHTHTAYVVETVIDECARRAGVDPVAFRLARYGTDPKHLRHRKALELAVAKARYGKKRLVAGRSWGVAVHESFQTVVAYIVEVSIEGADTAKRVVVNRVTAGVHCNTVVNPLSATAQIEGGMVYGMTGLLPGSEITIADGRPVQNQFSQFRVPRMSDMPAKVDIHFVPSDDAPTGLGEPGLPPYLPAVANALARLTGKIPTQLPLRDFV
jgi:isoquinoline 1-oxidoreductase beta subunit